MFNFVFDFGNTLQFRYTNKHMLIYIKECFVFLLQSKGLQIKSTSSFLLPRSINVSMNGRSLYVSLATKLSHLRSDGVGSSFPFEPDGYVIDNGLIIIIMFNYHSH